MDTDRTHCRGFVHFHVPGVPVGKGRPRFTKSGHTYTPAKTRAWEKAVRAAATGKDRLEGPLSALIIVYLPIPKSWSKKRQQEADGKPAIGRTDADNFGKAVLDACNEIVFADDRQVTDLRVVKRYTLDPALVGVGVTVEELE